MIQLSFFRLHYHRCYFDQEGFKIQFPILASTIIARLISKLLYQNREVIIVLTILGLQAHSPYSSHQLLKLSKNYWGIISYDFLRNQLIIKNSLNWLDADAPICVLHSWVIPKSSSQVLSTVLPTIIYYHAIFWWDHLKYHSHFVRYQNFHVILQVGFVIITTNDENYH